MSKYTELVFPLHISGATSEGVLIKDASDKEVLVVKIVPIAHAIVAMLNVTAEKIEIGPTIKATNKNEDKEFVN